MLIPNPAVVRAAALQAKFRAHAPQAIHVTAPVAPPSIAQLEARADDLRQFIIGCESQLKDPTLDLSDQYEAIIDEADEEIAAIEAQIETLEAKAQSEAPAPDVTVIVAQIDTGTTPATQLEVETENAHCEYLQIVNYFIDHPWLETDDASREIERRKARWQRFKTELDAETGA